MWSVSELTFNVLGQALMTSLLIQRLDAQQFSIWVIVQTALMASGLFSWGTSLAMFPALARAPVPAQKRILDTAIRMLLRRTAITLLILNALAALVVWSGFLPSRWWTGSAGQTLLVISTALFWAAFTEIDIGLTYALKAKGHFHHAALLEGGARFALWCSTFLLLDTGGNAALPLTLGISITGFKLAVKLRLLYSSPVHQTGDQVKYPSAEAKRLHAELGASTAWLWLGLLSGLLFNAVDRWLVGAQLGAVALGTYAVCLQIAQAPHALVAALGQPLTPWAARHEQVLHTSSGRRRLGSAFLRLTLAATLPSLALLFCLEPLLSIWISREFAEINLRTAQLLTLAFLLLSLNVPAYQMLLGLGRVRFASALILSAGLLYAAGCAAVAKDMSDYIYMRFFFPGVALVLLLQVGLLLKRRSR